jgi:hypothetical protein
MSASATSLTRTAERVPRWSSTGLARARPDRCPALLSTSLSSSRAIVIGAELKPIGRTSRRNHPTGPLPRRASTLIAAVKSP